MTESEKLDKTLSMLRNARNILEDAGYLYAREIDKFLLKEFKIKPPKRLPMPN